MTTLHDTIRALVTPTPYYPTKFPQETRHPTWPAIRGTIVGRDNALDQCGAGDLDEDDVRVQIDVCADTYDTADALFSTVCVAMAAANPAWIRQPGGFDGWDSEAKVHRFTADFVLYQSST